MRSILSKKGQLQTLAPSIIALVLAATLLIVGLVMIQELRDTDVVSKANTATATHETLSTVIDGTGETLAGASASACAVTTIAAINASGGEAIAAGNYSVASCILTAASSGPYNNTDWNVTYTYTYGDETYDSATSTVTGMGTFADFWEIIVLAIVISIVMGLLLLAFGGPGRR